MKDHKTNNLAPPKISSLHSAMSPLELPDGFFIHLLHKEDDWSLIIKLHALLEATYAEFITRNIGSEDISSIIANLEMSNSKIGKLAFAKSLGLTNSQKETFVRRLSELRNELVHKIQNVKFVIEDEIIKDKKTSLSKATINCVQAASVFMHEDILLFNEEDKPDYLPEKIDPKIKVKEFFETNDRFTIWFAAFCIISDLYEN
jgi:hypothetical protein